MVLILKAHLVNKPEQKHLLTSFYPGKQN